VVEPGKNLALAPRRHRRQNHSTAAWKSTRLSLSHGSSLSPTK
jgi:hypothetical protein